jgi:uncharacterized protein HemX
MNNAPIPISESSNVTLSLKLLWAILCLVAGGAVTAAIVVQQNNSMQSELAALKASVNQINSKLTERIEDHERRIIRIEARTMSSLTNQNQNVAAY